MSVADIELMLKEVEALLAGAGALPEGAEQAVEKLLNLVEALVRDNQLLGDEVRELRKKLEERKQAKTTAQAETDQKKATSDHSSEKRRPKIPKRRLHRDRRTFKDLVIHEERECPIDPATLPSDAIRVDDEFVVVQDVVIRPNNIRFRRSVYYSPSEKKYLRAPLPGGYDAGDFGAELRALILSLKYSGGMSEPKVLEFLENFDIQISNASVSNIMTRTADKFAQEVDDIVAAGLESTPFQQTDDTSARVAGEFWHTHILCNPFYAAYFTRARKDRLTLLEVLQNTEELQFQFGQETLGLLDEQFKVPAKWRASLEGLGEQSMDRTSLAAVLDGWFGEGNKQLRVAIEQASAIVAYRHQKSLPVINTIVCDDAGQFKLLTKNLALCWIHEGRHYERLSPVVGRHRAELETMITRFWDYYRKLQDYRAGPGDELASRLRNEFDELFSTRTGYASLDARIQSTAEKKAELLTVLLEPAVPLHNNASELQARVSARRRDVSLHSVSVRGARAMDIFTTIIQTAKLLGISAYGYLRDRLSKTNAYPSLAESITTASRLACLNC